jgi:hypothetical protein
VGRGVVLVQEQHQTKEAVAVAQVVLEQAQGCP